MLEPRLYEWEPIVRIQTACDEPTKEPVPTYEERQSALIDKIGALIHALEAAVFELTKAQKNHGPVRPAADTEDALHFGKRSTNL